MLKNAFLNIEFKEKPENPELEAEEIAKRIVSQNDLIKSVQFRYGAFGRVDKIKND